MLVYPARPWRNFKIDSYFRDNSYYAHYRKWHSGWDINLKSGGDTDLGYPIQSMFAGEVLDAQNFPGWGVNVRVRAVEPVRSFVAAALNMELEVLDINYCHLQHSTVTVGDIVAAGDHLGSIGKGDRNQYLAHLHFEVRHKDVPANASQLTGIEGFDDTADIYLDPAKLMALVSQDYSTDLPPRRVTHTVPQVNLNGKELETDRVIINRVGDRLWVRTEADTPEWDDLVESEP